MCLSERKYQEERNLIDRTFAQIRNFKKRSQPDLIVENIRSIQLAEGNKDCFRRTTEYCDRECAWKYYCCGDGREKINDDLLKILQSYMIGGKSVESNKVKRAKQL